MNIRVVQDFYCNKYTCVIQKAKCGKNIGYRCVLLKNNSPVDGEFGGWYFNVDNAIEWGKAKLNSIENDNKDIELYGYITT